MTGRYRAGRQGSPGRSPVHGVSRSAAVSLDDTIRALLSTPRTWAVVGCSPDPGRDSHRIARLLLERGNNVIPVNPAADEILGRRCHARLADVPDPVDVVDIFRRASAAGAHVDEAIAIGAPAVG